MSCCWNLTEPYPRCQPGCRDGHLQNLPLSAHRATRVGWRYTVQQPPGHGQLEREQAGQRRPQRLGARVEVEGRVEHVPTRQEVQPGTEHHACHRPAGTQFPAVHCTPPQRGRERGGQGERGRQGEGTVGGRERGGGMGGGHCTTHKMRYVGLFPINESREYLCTAVPSIQQVRRSHVNKHAMLHHPASYMQLR